MLFSAPMIRALQRRWKLQTRRLVKDGGLPFVRLDGTGKTCFTPAGKLSIRGWTAAGEYGESFRRPPCWAGDTLWARETWGAPFADHPLCPGGRKPAQGDRIVYRAEPGDEYQWTGTSGFAWRPSIFMPKWACRFRLPVTQVRAELLLDITNEDAMAEGIPQTAGEAQELGLIDLDRTPGHEWDNRTSRENYLRLWDTINPKYPAASNPAVWRLEFRYFNPEERP